MKKYLLGALFVLGTMAYAQGNRVIVPVSAAGDATANLGIEVTGEVFDKAQKSLVVDIQSAASADGTGFAFRMPHLFANDDTVKTAEGKFTAMILENNIPEAFVASPKVKLVKAGVEADTQTGTVSGTADNVEVKYNLAGGVNTAKTVYNGTVAVSAKAGNKTGTFSDTSVELRVEVNGQV